MILVDKSKRRNNAGRPKITEKVKDKAVQLYNEGVPIAKICKDCKISQASLYRIIRERSNDNESKGD